MDELAQHFKNLENDETLKKIDEAYNRGWNDAMNNPEIKKALERMKPKKVIREVKTDIFGEYIKNRCPTCRKLIYGKYVCEHKGCGQALDWS